MQQVPHRRQCVEEARQVAETPVAKTNGPVCTCERGAWGLEGSDSQERSLLPDTRGYISLADNQRLDIFADSVQWEPRRFYLL